MRFLWAVTIIGSVLGGLTIIFGLAGAEGAPQEAAAAAIGVAFAVIPYCLARAVSEMGSKAVEQATVPKKDDPGPVEAKKPDQPVSGEESVRRALKAQEKKEGIR